MTPDLRLPIPYPRYVVVGGLYAQFRPDFPQITLAA